MSAEIYGLDAGNNKVVCLSMEQAIALIQEMAANGWQVPDGYIPQTAVNSILEQSTGKAVKFLFNTRAAWNAYTGDKTDMHFIPTDDTTVQDLSETVSKIINGETIVGEATHAEEADNAKKLQGISPLVDTEDGSVLLSAKGTITITGKYRAILIDGHTAFEFTTQNLPIFAGGRIYTEAVKDESGVIVAITNTNTKGYVNVPVGSDLETLFNNDGAFGGSYEVAYKVKGAERKKLLYKSSSEYGDEIVANLDSWTTLFTNTEVEGKTLEITLNLGQIGGTIPDKLFKPIRFLYDSNVTTGRVVYRDVYISGGSIYQKQIWVRLLNDGAFEVKYESETAGTNLTLSDVVSDAIAVVSVHEVIE